MRIVCVMAHAKTYMRHVFRVINLMLLNNSFMPSLKIYFLSLLCLHTHTIICKKMSMKHVADPFTYIYRENNIFRHPSLPPIVKALTIFCVCMFAFAGVQCNE